MSIAIHPRRSLGASIRSRGTSLAQAQNTYKQNLVSVNTLVAGVLSSSMPTLKQAPPDWQSYSTAYVQACGDALDWVNNVLARLLNVPGEVQTYNTTISAYLQDAQAQAASLVNNPTNKAVQAALSQDLNLLSSQLNLVVTFISSAVSNIKTFQNKLPDMATQLQSIATMSAQDAKADQAQIAQLNADIAQLQSDINSLTAAIVGLGIADAVALTLGIVATIAAWPEGAVVWLVMGPAVAVASVYIGLDASQIVADNAKIKSDTATMNALTADVATLSALANNYANLAASTAQVETNLQAILAEWQTLQSDVNADIADIQAAISDSGGANYQAVANDLSNAVSEWAAAYAQAGALTVDLNVNTVSLQLGMSQSDVQAALAGGQVVGVIQYYNQMAS